MNIAALSVVFLFSRYAVSDSFASPWTVACQDPLSMRFPRQEYWSGWPFPPPGDLPAAGMEPKSPVLAGREAPWQLHTGL